MSDQSAPDPREPIPCSPCRGTGKVISGLGGDPHAITCPWCEGTGVQASDHDAQAAGAVLRGEQDAQPAG